jgi:hypothetical protein
VIIVVVIFTSYIIAADYEQLETAIGKKYFALQKFVVKYFYLHLAFCFEYRAVDGVEKSFGFIIAILLNQNQECLRFTFLKKYFSDPIP